MNNSDSVSRWALCEAAKRRLLTQLEELELPPFKQDLQNAYPLRFAFLEETVDGSGGKMNVITGHQEGVISFNLAEADSVYREKTRVRLHEPQRTLIGHMRHEIGHYIDWSWASRVAADEYRQIFGDPESVNYQDAMRRHYDQGPPQDWLDKYVSAYASMHPWEDFAETVNLYLDIMAIATTANALAGQEIDLSVTAEPAQIVASVLKIVVEVSEYNFDLGLLPLLPERFPEAVIGKLAFVHELRSKQPASQVASVN